VISETNEGVRFIRVDKFPAATSDAGAKAAYMREFLDTMCRISFSTLKGITPVV